MRLSVLDRSHILADQQPGEAIRDTVDFAREIERLGYHRFWVAEHHGVPGVAGSAPTVLSAAVAAATSRIRIGTGGVMLPNHQPLVVAEQFGVLGALHGGRVDVGLGRSVGFTAPVRRALGGDKHAAERFGAQITELLGYFTGEQRDHSGVRVLPAEGQRPPVFVLATGAGADTAAELGLPLVIAPVHGTRRMVDTISRYRKSFQPSNWAAAPYVVISQAVAVGESTEQARRLLVPEAWAQAYARTRGEFPALRAPEDILSARMTDRERSEFDRTLGRQIFGTAEEVGTTLRALIEETGAAEVMITTSGFDQQQRWDSYRRLARLVLG